MQQGGTGRHSPQPAKLGAGAAAASAVTVWDETTAWVCNMPDPVAAAEYLHRYMALMCAALELRSP